MPRLPARRLLTITLASMLAATVLVPLAPEPAAARDGSTFVQLVNERRAAHDVGPVGLHSVIDQISVERADQLADARALSHDLTYVKDRLAQAGVCWERLGEIIAYNGVSSVGDRIKRFVEQWYTSTKGHKELMLNPAYTHAGGSWSTGADGRHYAAMVFVKLCGASSAPVTSTSDPFTDISDSKFRSAIVWLAEEGITTGCTATEFCPKSRVLRDQMATFLARAMGLPKAGKNHFSDIRSNKHAERINRIAEAGVTHGCDTRLYCPSGRVTRAQMASFLARALGLPPTKKDFFNDDNGNKHEDAINRLAAAGITSGCDTKKFCPNGSVTREQMAAFIMRAFR